MSIDKLENIKIADNGTQALILRIVRDLNPISRSGIVEKTGQPHAAVSRSTSILLEKGVLTEEAHTDTNGPRRKRGLQLNGNYGYVLSVEYGPDRIEGVVTNTAYEIVEKIAISIDLASLPQTEIIEQVTKCIEQLQSKTRSCGICLGIAAVDPGIIDSDKGTSILASTIEEWKNVPIVEILEKRFKLPVKLLNTGISKIRAVDRLELNNAVENFIYIEYGTGIACGLKLNGTYISGHGNLAGELGHLRVTDAQIPCSCGGVGCLEAVASLSALAKNASQAIAGKSSILAGQKQISGVDVIRAAAEHDRLASRIVDEAFEKIGIAVAGLVNILSPKIVLFDNTIEEAGPEAVTMLLRTLEKSVLISHQSQLETKISSIKSHLGAFGGAASVLDECITA
ncbi:MAG: hypothetical protein A2Y10_03275 [Planctomycetes bacterium GWF2_41_51]|nr:MAG: hypothetical protein A2Y10_03275 [Planctomycetes bacterium GWF2_41_51]HBG27783.1 hypothetical protein [Phycisphaerales bacterium]